MTDDFPCCTQTPPGELAPIDPPPEHTGARPAAPTDWQPGDPLHAQSPYRQGLFTFREDGEGWGDAATWYADPTEAPLDRLLGSHSYDEVGDSRGRLRAMLTESVQG